MTEFAWIGSPEMHTKRSSNGYVYAALLAHLPDIVKIGCSRDVRLREQDTHLDVFYVEEDTLYQGGSGYIEGYKERLALDFAKQIGIWHSFDYKHSLPEGHPLEEGWTEYVRFDRRAQAEIADNVGEAFEEVRNFYANVLRVFHRDEEFGRCQIDDGDTGPAWYLVTIDDHARAEFDDGDDNEHADDLDHGPRPRVSTGAVISPDSDPDAADIS